MMKGIRDKLDAYVRLPLDLSVVLVSANTALRAVHIRIQACASGYALCIMRQQHAHNG